MAELYPKRDAVLEEDIGEFILPVDRTHMLDREMYESFSAGIGAEATQRNLEIHIDNVPDGIRIRWEPASVV